MSFNLLKLIPSPRLFLEVEKLVREVQRSGEPARKAGIPYQDGGVAGAVNVDVMAPRDKPGRTLLVLFEPAPGASGLPTDSGCDPKDREIALLKQNLGDARQRILSMMEEHQTSQEEEQNATVEAVSANEELQSLNEELETAKEELQSTNEELTTVNQELVSNNAALTEARDIARLIIETAAAPLLVLDFELRIKAANPAFYRAFGISPYEAEGQYLYSVSNRCWDIPRLRDMLEGILPARKAVENFEIEQDFPGLGHRVLKLSARQLDGMQQILLGVDDATEHKELDRRLAVIVESSDDAILSKTLDGTIVTWNSGAEGIYGYAAHEIIGQPITILSPHGYEDEMSTIMERIRRGEKLRHFETKRRHKDGEIIDVSLTISPIKGPDGVVTGASIIARDITELKHRQQDALTKQKLESVGTLAGGIAHDFNNLLGGILAQSELALTELASGSRPVEQLQGIRTVAIRGAEVVRQLMIYSGQESDVLEPVDVSRIVQEMIQLLKVSVSKHAALETDLGKDLPAVQANPGQIRRIVMNLITNASDAIGDRDGVIRVTTRRVTLGRSSPVISAVQLAEGDYLQLTVADTGHGMPPEMQGRVFDPFYTTKLAGHGLGLAVVQGIVRGLGGIIRLASNLGKGTIFEILLPCAGDTVRAAPGINLYDEEETLGPQQATILFVEDEELLRNASAKMLREKGLSVFEASNGTAALDLIRAQHVAIDVLLLDVTLPGASSREVFEEAKRLRPDIKVIVTSGNGGEFAAALIGGPVERFLRKPYRMSDVMAMIRGALSS